MTELYINDVVSHKKDPKERNGFEDDLDDPETGEFIGKSLETMDALMSARHLGGHRVLKRDAHGNILYTLGPHWYVAVVGWTAIFMLGVSSLYSYWAVISTFKQVSFSLLVLTECSLYMYTALLNPGIKSRAVPQFAAGNIYCEKCLTTTEDKVYHCYECDVCIEGHDHHCIWTGKCIGKGNFTPFIFFVVCTPCYFITLFLLIGQSS